MKAGGGRRTFASSSSRPLWILGASARSAPLIHGPEQSKPRGVAGARGDRSPMHGQRRPRAFVNQRAVPVGRGFELASGSRHMLGTWGYAGCIGERGTGHRRRAFPPTGFDGDRRGACRYGRAGVRVRAAADLEIAGQARVPPGFGPSDALWTQAAASPTQSPLRLP